MICQRCTKNVSGEGVHTCSPSDLVRKLEEESAMWKASCLRDAARVDELAAENAALKEHVADHQLLFKDYAAAQHRIKQLREAVEFLVENEASFGYSRPYDEARAVLALPDSTAELDAVMKDAERWRNLENKMMEQPK